MRLAAALLLPLFAIPLYAQTIQINKENRTVAVTAIDQAEASADLAAVSIGYVTYGADQTQTYGDATRISNAVIDAVRATGVPADAIESREQNLTAVDEDDKTRFNKGIRFRGSQSWQVTVPAASAAAVLHEAILAGANESGNIQWKLKSEEALEAAAAAKALAHARQVAERLAQGLGAKLGPLVYASDQQPHGPIGPMMAASPMMAKSRAARLKPLAISPDRIFTSVTVYAVFSLE